MTPKRLVGALVMLAACGAPRAPSLPLHGEGVTDEAAGTQIVLVPRSTDGRLWLSLWMDAGARDAASAPLATLTLWAAAASEAISVRVLPDGVELTRSCRRAELARCLEELATTVGTRRVDPERWDEAQRRFRAAYQRAASDEARRTDTLALEALLGRDVDPLGGSSPEPTIEQAQAFLADHAGPGRLLLVAVGDAEPRALRDAVQAAFAGLPGPNRRRARRALRGARTARVEVGESHRLALGTLRPSVADAARLARRLVARVATDAPAARASADVFPVRGGAAVVARVEGSPELQRALLEHAAELIEEPPLDAPDPPPSEDGPRALARWIGLRWACRQDEAVQGGLGLGALVAGGRGDRPGEEDPDRALREGAVQGLERALGEAGEPPRLEGRVSAEEVDVRLAGGGQIRARRLRGAARLSAVALFEGGASEDTADEHGATALLATMASEGCDEVARRELGQTLESLGVETAALLTADAWGLRVEGPPARWREIAYLTPRCAGVPRLDAARLESARAARLAVLAQPTQRARAAAAELLAPASPGRVAPGGSARGLEAVTARSLAAARRRRVGRARARLGLAGDVRMDDAVRILARGTSRWAAGEPAEASIWAPSHERLRGLAQAGEGYEAVVAWTVAAPGGASVVGEAFASAAARALSAEPGLRVSWHEGGAAAEHAFARVGLETSVDSLDALPRLVARALGSVRWGQVAEEALLDGEERRAWSESSPRRVAMALASGGVGAPPDRTAVVRALQQLAESAPYYVIVRPQPRRR